MKEIVGVAAGLTLLGGVALAIVLRTPAPGLEDRPRLDAGREPIVVQCGAGQIPRMVPMGDGMGASRVECAPAAAAPVADLGTLTAPVTEQAPPEPVAPPARVVVRRAPAHRPAPAAVPSYEPEANDTPEPPARTADRGNAPEPERRPEAPPVPGPASGPASDPRTSDSGRDSSASQSGRPADQPEEREGRTWKRHAVIIAGSAAGGAAIGGILGGGDGAKKGAILGGIAGVIVDVATNRK